MITAEIYEARRLFKWHWRFRFIASNGQVYGHQYNNIDDARRAVERIVGGTTVYLRTRHRDGTIVDHGRIR